MLKVIGFALVASGAILFIVTLILAQKNKIRDAASELSLIKKSGYVVTHKETGKGIRIDKDAESRPKEIKIAPKKRTISKEAQEILEKVEKEKRAEREARELQPSQENLHTGILDRKKSTITDSDTEDGGTGILERRRTPSDNTDIMRRKAGTDLLKRDPGTDILKREASSDDGTGILKRGSSEDQGTGILERKNTGPEATGGIARKEDDATGVLKRNKDEEETGILKRRKGNEEVSDTGTGILRKEN